MNHDLTMAVTSLTERLVAKAVHDDELWEDLRSLARAVLAGRNRCDWDRSYPRLPMRRRCSRR